MNEHFNIHILRYVIPYTLYIFNIYLTGKHYSLRTHLVQLVCSYIVYHSRLCRNMDLKIGNGTLYQSNTADVAYYCGIYSAVVCGFYKFGEQFYLIV